MLTSRYPSFHELGFFNEPGKARVTWSIGNLLRPLGYDTAAFVSTTVLRRESGLDVGFDYYDDSCPKHELNRPELLWRRGGDTLDAALRWLEMKGEDKCFTWIHLMDIHGPYCPPPPFDSSFVGDNYWQAPRSLESVHDGDEGGIPAFQLLCAKRDASGDLIDYEHDWNYYVSQYDGSIRYVDEVIGQFVERLKDRGYWYDTLLFITADHGEAMGENNVFFFHGLTVTLDTIRVPLLIKPPKDVKTWHEVVEPPCSTLDIVPTILEALGYDYHFLGVQGISLWPQIISETSSPQRFIFSETEGQCSLITGQYQHLSVKPEPADPEFPFALPKSLRKERLIDYRASPVGEQDISYEVRILERLRTISQQFIPLAQLAHSRIRGMKQKAEDALSTLSEDETARLRERLARLGYI